MGDLEWIREAERRVLSREALARIDAYQGSGAELHELLPAVLPLPRPIWYEAEVTAQHGTRTVLGYGVRPAGDDAIEVVYEAHAPAYDRTIGPIGPVRVTAAGMDPPDGCSEAEWRELRAAAGIVIRALLLGLGEVR
jgi:hypothetical protein